MSRKAGHAKPSDGEQVMTQVWHGVVDTLRRLPTVGEPTAQDDQTIDDALEQLDLLISLRKNQATQAQGQGQGDRPSDRGTTPHVPPMTANPTITVATPSTPSSSTGPTTGKRRKRQSISLSPAPAPTALDSPLRTNTGPPLKKERSATPSFVKERDGAKGSGSSSSGLPLAPGRRVAFFQTAAGEEEGWILGTIKRCLGEKYKYEVTDADDKTKSFETTLKFLIPLPDAHTPASQLEVFPRNSIVLGLYPDTTAFYQATVIATPSLYPGFGTSGGLTARGGGKAEAAAAAAAKKGKYVLAFVDDGDNQPIVNPADVIKFPG